METKRVRFVEHLAVSTPMSLEDVCTILQRELGLPTFRFDPRAGATLHVSEFSLETEEPECGFAEKDGIEYNISRYPSQRFDPQTLQIRDLTVPEERNFGIALVISNDCPEEANLAWGSSELVPRVAQRVAKVLGEKVYYHRTCLHMGELTWRESFVRGLSFLPGNGDA